MSCGPWLNVDNYSIKCQLCEAIKISDLNASSVNIHKCDSIMRILTALKYYSLLKLDENPSNQDVFISFCKTVYPYFLNDYEHILHSYINQQIIEDAKFGDCDHQKCKLFTRYYSDSRRRVDQERESKNNDEEIDSELLFYRQIFDNIHHWLYHLFDVGVRMMHDMV